MRGAWRWGGRGLDLKMGDYTESGFSITLHFVDAGVQMKGISEIVNIVTVIIYFEVDIPEITTST